MNRKGIGNADILFLLKCLLLSYLLTGACLMILALLLYKLRLSYPLPLSSFMWQPYFLQDFLREKE